jgi:hypothetical protein
VASGCPAPLSPICAIGSGVGSIVSGATGSVANDVLSAIVGWIVDGADWLLQHIGDAISSTTSVHVEAPWFESHYAVMASIAAILAVPMLLLAAIQAVFQQSPSVLLRAAFVQLPLAGLLTAVAVQLVQLSLTATDELCSMVSASSGGDIAKVLGRVGTALMTMGVGPMPGFIVTVGGLLIVAGGLVLWLELVVRAAAIYVAVLFLPLALASLVWPAVSHWCRRLVDTIAALVLSKFVVVSVLSLAVGALGNGTGFDAVLAGGALLLLAAFTPFSLLRLLPMLEVGAAMQLEGARQRVRHAVASMPTGAASYALARAKQSMIPPADPGPVGSGSVLDAGAPGSTDGGTDPADGGGPPGSTADGAGFGFGQGAGGALDVVSEGGGGAGEAAFVGAISPEAALASRLSSELGKDTLVPPPGGIPIWEGDPVATKQLLEHLARLEGPPIPDGAGGGALPGVQNPLYGGNVPANRFVPGPADRWPGWPSSASTGGGEATSSAGPTGPSGPLGPSPEAAREEMWSPWDDEDDPDIPSEYFFD